MSFIDWIKELLKNDSREIVKIQGKDLTKTLGSSDKFCCAVYTQKKNLLTGVPVVFKVNGVEYERKTDSTGLACLSINLECGTYSITSTFKGDNQYADASTTNIIRVAPVLTAQDLSMSYHDGSSFNVKATDNNGNPIANTNIEISINNVTYKRLTNENGVASLRINLQAGTYPITCSCNGNSINNTVTVAKATTRMEGTDINKVVGDSTAYQCAIYTPQNNRIYNGNVDITVNGKTYSKSIDSEGLAKLNINLGKGDYTIKAEYKGDNNYTGSSVTNTCKITEPAPAPSKLYEYLTNTGCSGMGQCTPYYCACNSLQEAFYRLTGIHIAESTIASIASTTTAGTDHWGINTAVAWFNRKYDKNVKIVWKNFSDLGSTDSERWMKLVEYTSNGAVFCHMMYRNQWGHYEPLKSVNKDTVTVLNSLGSRCNSPAYCGYIETRSKSTQLSYMKGISQPSIAYLYI